MVIVIKIRSFGLYCCCINENDDNYEKINIDPTLKFCSVINLALLSLTEK